MSRIASGCVIGLLTACGGGAIDPDAAVPDAGIDAPATTGSIDVTWEVLDRTTQASCPPGATTATLFAQLDTGPLSAFSFPCEAGAGATGELLGQYTTWFELTDDAGSTIYARSPEVGVWVGAGPASSVHFTMDGYNAYLQLSWGLQTSAGAPTTCAAVANGGVRVEAIPAGGSDPRLGDFACTFGEGFATAYGVYLPIGDSVVSVSIVDGSDVVIGQSSPINVTVDYATQLIDLNDVVITLQ